MKILLLFVAAQLVGNAISLLIAAAVWHITRPRLVAIGTASRLDSTDDVLPNRSYVIKDGGAC